MERPNHLHVANQNNSSKVTGLVIVVVLHVIAVFGLVVALNQGAIQRRIQDIKATVEVPKEIPKAPPPPPVDVVPPPPVTIVQPAFTINDAPPREAPHATPAPPTPSSAPAATSLSPIRSTFTTPPYPVASLRSGEQGSTTLKLSIGTDGHITDAVVTKSSGSERLDQAAVEWVKARYRYRPPTVNGQPTTAQTLLNIIWNLKDAR